ncbi:carbon-monoxide dehydrogenase large subunit [Gemmatimonadetes bacterium T265]|nr:carbon-monoxide dehydrogenase large subunit [Gemmatimonadetes bacterium T265]
MTVPRAAEPSPTGHAVGEPLPRVDGPLKVTGAATYAAEWRVPGLAHGAVVDSAVARGTIRAIDASAALAAPGVIAVVTHENAPRLGPYPDKAGGQQLTGEGGLGEVRQPLQDATLHYGAQSIAVVVAETFEQAQYAATLMRVDYDAEPPELDLETASWQTTPEIFAGSEPLQKGGDDVRAALAAAPVRLTREYHTPVYHHNPIELLASIAIWEERDGEDVLTLYDTTRGVDVLRDTCALAFDLPPQNVHVVSKFIGGAFGSKGWSFHNPILVALAARVANRPVKVEWRRQQFFSVGGHRPAVQHHLDVGAARDGTISALAHDGRTHGSMVSGYIEFAARMTKMMYGVPHLGYAHRLSHLNLPTPATLRGPGFLISGFALESALDELAGELGMDPVALRLQNHAETDPESGLPFSSKHLRECYARGRARFGWDARPPAPRTRRENGLWVGYGMSSAMHPADRTGATARATICADGTALVRSATHELGNGAYTIFRQIAADGLALPVDRVRFDLGDTTFPTAPPTLGSLSTASVGPAVLAAARRAVRALAEVAVRTPGSPLFGTPADAVEAAGGRLRRRDDPSVGEDYGAVLRRAGLPHVAAGAGEKPGDEKKQFAFYSFGAVFAEVRVDEATGVVRVARLCGVYDVGRLINPRTARSQVMGGMLFALGVALTEESLFDPVTGLPVVRNLADYHVASCADTPEIDIEMLGIPDPHIGELGAHGVGEMGTSGVPAAIANAVYNATGRRVRSLPITPDKVLQA